MKKLFAFLLLAACLTLFLFGFASAESWTCPQCGSSASGNFCSNCGTAKPSGSSSWTCPSCGHESTGRFCSYCGASKPSGGSSSSSSSSSGTISNVSCSTRDGITTITWDDSADKGPYEVVFSTPQWENAVNYNLKSISRKRASTSCLIPGVTYEVTVKNASTRSRTINYKVPKSTFTDFTKKDALTIKPTTFDLSGSNYYSTFRLDMNYPRLKNNREYTWLIALKTPLGYSSYVHYDENFELDRQYSGYYWDWGVSDHMDAVKSNFGEIPNGEYSFECYFNGCYYGSVSFKVYMR